MDNTDRIATLPRLYDFQRRTIEAALSDPTQRKILHLPTGAGKTRTTIELLIARGCPKTLIVCPNALIGSHWLRQLEVWKYPEGPSRGVIAYSRERTKGLSKKRLEEKEHAYNAHVQIVSFDLLTEELLESAEHLVIDEAHRIRTPGIKASQLIQNFALKKPSAPIVGLTATPLADRPSDIYGIVHALWPGRLGEPYRRTRIPLSFYSRYMLPTTIELPDGNVVTQWKQANPLFLPELQYRLESMLVSVDAEEVYKELPGFSFTPLSVVNKTSAIKDWVNEATEEASHVCILTYYRNSAAKLAKMFGGTLIRGDIPPLQRDKIIQEELAKPKSLLVASIKSIQEGVELTQYTRVCFYELYSRPLDVIQVIGRFANRLSSKNRILFSALSSGYADERVAYLLEMKINQNQSLLSSANENALKQAFSLAQSDEEFFTNLLSKVESSAEDDYFT